MRAGRLLRALCVLAMTTGLFFAQGVFAEELASLQASFLRGDYDGVVREAKRLDQGGPGLSDGMLYLWGVSAMKLERSQEARQILQRLIDRYSSSRWRGQARLLVGQILEEEGEDIEAAKRYTDLLEGGGGADFPQAALRLGRIQMKQGLWEESRRSLETLVRKMPDSPEAEAARQLMQQGTFYYCVQVGAFSAEGNAGRLAGELKRRGYAAEESEGLLQGKRFYRVRVGRFASRREAEEQLRRLRQDGFPGKIFP